MKKGDIVIGTRLRTFRKQILNISIRDISMTLEISENVVGKIERGDLSADFKKLQLLNENYLLNLNWLICGLGNPVLKNEETEPFTDEIKKLNQQEVSESRIEYGNKDLQLLTMQVNNLTTERDLYKKLYEKQEIEVEFYKSQLKK